MSEPVATGVKKYRPRTWNEAKTCSAVALQMEKNISDDHNAYMSKSFYRGGKNRSLLSVSVLSRSI